MASGVRVDKWLWSVRLFKTRTAATKACDQGQVSVLGRDGDEPAKPARRVNEGDRITVKRRHGVSIVVVRQLLEKRVGAPVAVEAYEDLSPPPEPRTDPLGGVVIDQGTRERGAGRPTKRERRQIDRLRDRR